MVRDNCPQCGKRYKKEISFGNVFYSCDDCGIGTSEKITEQIELEVTYIPIKKENK